MSRGEAWVQDYDMANDFSDCLGNYDERQTIRPGSLDDFMCSRLTIDESRPELPKQIRGSYFYVVDPGAAEDYRFGPDFFSGVSGSASPHADDDGDDDGERLTLNHEDTLLRNPLDVPGVEKVMACLGHGGFCRMYHCQVRSQQSDAVEDVVVKIFGQSLLIEECEIKLLQSLYHPNLLALKNTMIEAGVLTQEHCGGGTLQALLDDETTRNATASLDLYARLSASKGVVDALCYLQSQDIVHGAIRSTNCYLSDVFNGFEFPTMKLGDLCSTRMYSVDLLKNISGAVLYFAPEVLECGLHNHSADVFSCGNLLYAAIAAKLPYNCKPRSVSLKLVNAIIAGERPNLEVFSDHGAESQLKGLLASCWVEPGDRVSASNFLQQLFDISRLC